ncbi:VWA domain-containing protein [Candidatus Kuenenbacteria bacterium]|nr:VWA domain-containing protein [Candidatus Kuenenbacteria bacterium]
MNIVIVDASGSMYRFGEVPQASVNQHLEDLKTPPDGREQICMVVSFADQWKINVIPCLATEVVPMTDYDADGNTLLYKTVYKVIRMFLDKYKLSAHAQENLEVVIGVFSDGDDTRSKPPYQTKDYQPKLQAFAGEAIEAGWHLHSFGLGIDAVDLATKMGFPTDEDHCHQSAATPEGVRESTMHFTECSTRIFDQDFKPQTEPGDQT